MFIMGGLKGLLAIILGPIFLVFILVSQLMFHFRNKNKLGIDLASQELKEYCQSRNNLRKRKESTFDSLYFVEHKNTFDFFEKRNKHFYHIKNLSKKDLILWSKSAH